MDPEPSTLRFQQMPAWNSDGLLANRAFMRAVDMARARAEQQKAEAGGLLAAVGSGLGSHLECVPFSQAATRLPGGVKQLAPLCLSQLSAEKLYEGDWLAVIPPPTMKQ